MEVRAEKVKQTIDFLLFFSIIKNVFHYMFAKCFLPDPDAYDLQPAVSDFGSTRAQGAILAHTASRMTFHGYFESTSTKQYQYSTKFMRSYSSSNCLLICGCSKTKNV